MFGPLSISERVIQRIWLHQDFNQQGLSTTDGQNLVIVHPGKWNPHEGPDFLGAKLRIGNDSLTGDVEIHIYERDWYQHQHDKDPNYDKVVLHVVLYQPLYLDRKATLTLSGNALPTLRLLDYLEKDLEAHAADQALQRIHNNEHTDLLEWMLAQEPAKRINHLREGAKTRWRQKLAFAHQRLKTDAWEDACHQMTLEVLGYRRNRSAMSDLALRYPIMQMRHMAAETLFQASSKPWQLNGLRPANHPKHRLEQYTQLLRSNPKWPAALKRWGEHLHRIDVGLMQTHAIRREFSFASARQTVAETIIDGTVGGSRLDTLCVDAFLPLLAAELRKELFAWWYHWQGGDLPDTLTNFLKQCGVYNSKQPTCNGLNQGALQLLLEESYH